MLRLIVILTVLATATTYAAAWAVIVELVNGERVDAELIVATEKGITVRSGGRSVDIKPERVRAIYFNAPADVSEDARRQGDTRRRARIAKAQADVRAIASAVSMYAAHMGSLPKMLREITLPSRNRNGQSSGAFLQAIPQAPPGWTPYTYTSAADGTFTLESSGDGTIARVP